MKNFIRVRLPYKPALRPIVDIDDDDAPEPIIFFPAPTEIKAGEFTAVFPPPPHKKLSRADYERLRLSEANIDDWLMYDKLVEKAEQEGLEFIKLLVDELVKVAPNDYLNQLIEYYYRIKASTGPTGPTVWTDEKLEEFTKYANEAIKAVKAKKFTSLRAAILIGKIFPDEWLMNEENYYKVKPLAESKGNVIEPLRKAKS